ncbi:MAG: Ig-like domain-containing protein, partial [Holdemanella sp.]|nr:Ig-like domain-containing protein [Holdemanella sp.]
MKKLLLSIVSISLVLFNTVNVYANDVSDEEYISAEEIYINPVYEGIVTEEDILGIQSVDFSDGETAPLFETKDEAAIYLRGKIENHEPEVELQYTYPLSEVVGETTPYAQAQGSDILERVWAHTGNPTQGDYLRWHYGGCTIQTSGSLVNGTYYVMTYTYVNILYYTTAAEEVAVGTEIDRILNDLDVYNESDYVKAVAVYNWITTNVRYDNDHLDDESYKKQYTAYAALFDGTCVCQGYANLFYRMMLTLGVDNRMITGNNHAWNIVKIGNYYYDLDATWDEGVPVEDWEYFLIDEASFSFKHPRKPEYTTTEFMETYPMAEYRFTEVTTLAFDEETMEKPVGETGKLSVHVQPDTEAARHALTFTSSNPDIVEISNDGQYVCKQKGMVTMTVSHPDGHSASMQMNVTSTYSGWKDIDGNTYYYVNGEYVTGIQEIEGKTYVFDGQGRLIHDGFVECDGNYYYVEHDALVNGKQRIEGKWYYFDNFIMQTG